MLVLVVGPSGAGKDTLLDVARATLADDGRFQFTRRTITRAAEAGGEAHEAVSPEAFAQRRFALQWHAHGIDYGIPLAIEAKLAAGCVVVASVSRTVIAEAATRYAVRVIEVSAPAEVLAARLAARGREGGADIARRLARAVTLPAGIAVELVMNDTTVEIGAARFLAALSRAAETAPR